MLFREYNERESVAMSEQAWYKDGLQFQCTQCGDCCTGAPGYVWVNQEEIELLALKLGVGVAEFERKYVRQVGVRRSLIEFDNGVCVFFDCQARQCTVYDARPMQDRTCPLWQSNIESHEAWE